MFSYDVLSHHMMPIYPIMCMQLSFVQVSLLCYEFCILSKTECKSIYYHFRRNHESSSFRKLARNKCICRETCDFFFLFYFIILYKDPYKEIIKFLNVYAILLVKFSISIPFFCKRIWWKHFFRRTVNTFKVSMMVNPGKTCR